MMRAYRLFEHICDTSQVHDCDAPDETIEMLEIVRADVNQRRVCTGVMGALPNDLFYSPIPVDLSAPEG